MAAPRVAFTLGAADHEELRAVGAGVKHEGDGGPAKPRVIGHWGVWGVEHATKVLEGA